MVNKRLMLSALECSARNIVGLASASKNSPPLAGDQGDSDQQGGQQNPDEKCADQNECEDGHKRGQHQQDDSDEIFEPMRPECPMGLTSQRCRQTCAAHWLSWVSVFLLRIAK